MNTHLIEYIRLSSIFAFVIPLIFYLRTFKAAPLQNHTIALLTVISGTTDIISLFAAPAFLHNIFETIQFTLFSVFYYQLVYKKRAEHIFLMTVGVYIAALIYCVVFEGVNTAHSILWVIGAVTILIHTIVYIVNISTMVTDRYFDMNLLSNMIFAVSLVMYFFVALLVFLLLDIITAMNDLNAFKAFWTIHNVFNILKNVGFALAFYYTGKRKIYMTVEQLERIARTLEQEQLTR